MINNYQVIAPVINKKLPYITNYGTLVVSRFHKKYKYYVEVKQYDTYADDYNYYILLSEEKFDEQCRTCRIDDYGRLFIVLHKDILEYAKAESERRGNLNFEQIDSSDEFDLWKLN